MRSIFTLLSCRIVLILLSAALSVQTLQAQTHTPKTVAINAACGGYYEYLPQNYSTTTGKYPLLIYIAGGNGAYGNGTTASMAILLNQGVPRIINLNQMPKTFTVNGQTTSFIMISPQFRYKPSPVEVNNFIDFIVNAYPRIDRERICLTGFSIGGDVAWKTPYDLASASRLAALVPVAGYNNPYSDANAQFIAAGKLPVWAIHSNSDGVPVGWTVSMVNKINTYNPTVPPLLTRPNGLTHEQTHVAIYEPGYKPNGLNVYEWCLQFRRSAATNPPVVNAGTDKAITLPVNSASLTGSATDPDGGALTYAWTKLSGPTSFTITNPSSANTTVTGLTAGEYQFQLEVTDATGLKGKATVKVTVQSAPNQLPVANAGSNVSITLPTNSTTLSSAGSADPEGTISSYSWVKISGPAAFAINNASAANPVISGLSAGTYSVQLTVTDNNAATAKDTVIITVNPAPNQLPVANAGADVTITLPQNSVTLNGNGSSDPDGSIASYSWAKQSGPASFTISNANVVNPVISGLTAGSYSIQLTVTDNSGATSTDLIAVTVNAAPNQTPVANAGSDVTVTLPQNSVTLNGSASSDPDGNIASYNWTRQSGPTSFTISNANVVSPVLSNLVAGTYSFQLTVTDNNGATNTDAVSIVVNPAANQLPVANAGADVTITLPQNSVTLNGNGSSDPDGSVASYSWTKQSGPASFTISNAGVVSPVISNLTAGTYSIQLTVTDNSGASSTDLISITVNPAANQLPVANAGADVTITLPQNSVTLNGGASSDPDGSIASYSWTKQSGPASFTISNVNVVNPVISGLTAGTYSIQLTVTDNSGATGTDLVVITVNPAANQLPVANAGSDQSVTLPVNSVSLSGSLSTDADGSIAAYQWRQVAGPANSTITGATVVNATASGLVEGTYRFELLVRDNSNATARDTIEVVVSPARPSSGRRVLKVNIYGGSNPASAEWNNWNVQSSLTLSNAKYADGSASGISVSLNINNALADNGNNYPVTMCPVEVGRYTSYSTVMRNVVISGLDNSKQYELEVYSSRGGTGNSTRFTVGSKVVNVLSSNNYANKALFEELAPAAGQIRLIIERLNTYNYINGFTLTELGTEEDEPNQAPVAAAGADQQIQLPANTAQLNAAGSSDSDGSIAAYSWTKISGPASFAINNAAIVNPVISNLTAGSYSLQLTVTDNEGAVARDTVVIVVNSIPNVAPVANAGANQSVNLPSNTVSLNGAASSDADGSIASYQWRQLSGPANATLNNSTSSVATATNLIEGMYRFELTVRDNNSAEAKDTTTVTVNAPLLSERIVKVNIYGGANPAGTEWNNWNVQSNLTFTGLKYSDGTASTISVSMNLSNAIADNGAGYPVTMCPVEVGRTTSYSTVGRIVTLTGLDNTKRYELEVYGSRNGTGNSTRYSVGGTSITILTDRNYTNKAVFSNLTPTAGQIRLSVDRLNTYNYINGFVLREVGSEQSLLTSRSAVAEETSTSTNAVTPEEINTKIELGTYPNPFRDNLDLQVNNDKTGVMNVIVVNQAGLPVKQLQFMKEQGTFRRSFSLQDLQPGVYFLRVQMQGWSRGEKIVKMK